MEHGLVYKNTDSYCGPISMLTALPDDEVLLVFREAKWRGSVTHADPTTRTTLIRSRDRGATWFSPVSPDPAGGNGSSIGRLADGTLLVNTFHWQFESSDRPTPQNQWEPQRPASLAGVFIARSLTDGYTWTACMHVAEPEGCFTMSCAGAILELGDGDLLLPLTARHNAKGTGHAMVMRSSDRGATWRDARYLTEDAPDYKWSETRLALCASGRVIAMHRTHKDNYFFNLSDDGGRTWQETHDSGIWCGGSSPPDLLRLADGRLLLTRGHRKEPFGVRCNLSTDDGETWGEDIILRDDGLDRDVGYPSTIQFTDGSLLSVYYWHDDDGIRHLQRTNWSIDG